jgi:hypothetical protein
MRLLHILLGRTRVKRIALLKVLPHLRLTELAISKLREPSMRVERGDSLVGTAGELPHRLIHYRTRVTERLWAQLSWKGTIIWVLEQ